MQSPRALTQGGARSIGGNHPILRNKGRGWTRLDLVDAEPQRNPRGLRETIEQKSHQGAMVEDPTNGFGLTVGISQIIESEPGGLKGGPIIQTQRRKGREMRNQVGPESQPLEQTPRRMGDGVGTTAIEKRLTGKSVDEVNGMALMSQPQRQ